MTVSGGSQVLDGDSTFTGALTVSGGSLTINGTGSTATTTVNVSGTGTLHSDSTDANGALANTGGGDAQQHGRAGLRRQRHDRAGW